MIDLALGETPLICAIKKRDIPLIMLFLNNERMEIEMHVDIDGHTALHSTFVVSPSRPSWTPFQRLPFRFHHWYLD